MKAVVRQNPVDSGSILPRPFSAFSPSRRLFPALVVVLICVSTLAFAQRRPKLKPMTRDYFAGKLLLIPRDDRTSSVQQPRMIAEVADHELITPPAKSFNDSEQFAVWAKTVNYDEIDGAIVSLDRVSAKETWQGRFELVKQLRRSRPQIPIYGFITLPDPSNQIAQATIDLGTYPLLDLLLINYQDQPGEDRRKTLLTTLKSELKISDFGRKIVIDDNPDAATITLLARMINQRFGFAPKVLPVYSSTAERGATVNGYARPLHELVSDRIRKFGGIEVSQTPEGARNVDLLLFVQTAQTRAQDRPAFVEAIAQTIDRNVRIGLVDLSETRESRDALISELRRRKMLDKLTSYASFDPATERSEDALTRALAQSSSFLVSIRFLRDDPDRVRRFDRAQVSLLISRYLTDWAFPFQVRPKLQSSSDIQPPNKPAQNKPAPNDQSGSAQSAELMETTALDQLKPVAEDLFNDQFKRNVHALLLSNGERAQYEVRLLQRLLVRLSPPSNLRQAPEIEVRPSIYLVHLGTEPVPQLRSQKLWQISNVDSLDERIVRRWDAIDWPSFKTDADSVEMVVKIAAQSGSSPDSQEGYSILSKRMREVRRLEITAPSAQGVFNALGKLERLGADGQLAQNFQINEKPGFLHRGMIESPRHLADSAGLEWSHRDRMEMLRFLGRVQMNRYYYFPIGEREGQSDKNVKELLQVANENFVQFIYGIYLPLSNIESTDQGFASVTGQLDRLAGLGVRHFIIHVGTPAERAQGIDRERLRNIASAQVSLSGRLREYLKRSGNFELSIWPWFSAGSLVIDPDYLKALAAAIPPDIQVMVPAEIITEKSGDVIKLISRRLIVQTEVNSDIGWGGGACFRPNRLERLKPDEAIGFVARSLRQLPVSKLILATASDYAWSGRGDAEQAFNSAMNLLYDERTRSGIRAWAQILGDCQSSGNPFASLFMNRSGHVSMTEQGLIEQKLAELQSAIEVIGGTRERGLLRGDLAQFIVSVRNALGISETQKE